jgi:uncharacterized protein DUF6688
VVQSSAVQPPANESMRAKVVRVAYALALAVGYGGAVGALFVSKSGLKPMAWGALPAGIWAFVALAPRDARRWAATQVLLLGVVPAWGYALNASLADCTQRCADDYRLLASPEINGLYAGYLATLVAYSVCRARPEMQRPATEVALLALLLAGVALMVPVGVHYAPLAPFGLLFAPVALPLLAPYAVAILYGAEFVRRARRRGADEAERRRAAGLAAASALASPLLLGLYAVAHALWLGHAKGAADVFTQTCGEGYFAALQKPVGDCHYLCTVAAQGHPRLVKPERLGRRRGQTIIVNRQLAVANAFEDLLHERWPRFGRAARRLYDRVGLPVSSLVRSRLVADAIYLAMKPAEWCFYLALLLLDRGPPEGRIARMYR